MVKIPKRIGISEAKSKIMKYCAYQERSHLEVKNKLIEMGLPYADIDEVLLFLMKNNFLNEARFSNAFVGGKFRTKAWGKNKIKQELMRKGVTPNLIEKSIQAELSDADYLEKLKLLLEKKWGLLGQAKDLNTKGKLFRYALQKGYEQDLIINELKRMGL